MSDNLSAQRPGDGSSSSEVFFAPGSPAPGSPAPAAPSSDSALPPTGNPLGDAPVGKLLLTYAPPAILSMVVTALYNIIDTFFVGHGVGENGIAATTVAFPLMMLISAFGAWFGTGGNALAAIKLGEGKKDVAEKVMGTTVFLLIVVPVTLSVIALLNLDPILDFLGATDLNRQHSHDFCSIIIAGFVLSAVGTGLSNFIRTDGSPNRALVIMVVGALLSCVANWLLVMVLGLGMTGSALATIIGQALTCVLVVRYFLSDRCRMRLSLRNMRPVGALAGKVVFLGLSTFLVQVAGSLTSSMLNLQITALGATDLIGSDGGLAVIGTVNKVIQLMFFVILGFSVAAQPILGFNYGAQRYRRVRKALWMTVGSATAVNLILWALCLAFSNQIMSFFGLGPELHEFASRTQLFMTFMFPVVPFQVIGSNYFQATGQPLKATALSLTRQLVFYLPSLFIVPTLASGMLGLSPLACLPLAPSVADGLAILTTVVFVVLEMRRLTRIQQQHDERLASHETKWSNVERRVNDDMEHLKELAREHRRAKQAGGEGSSDQVVAAGSVPSGRGGIGSADEFVRAEREDDDGYDPYSDRPAKSEPLFERDPWA